MLDKTKWAPKPPPEPVITGSLEPGPKKRGRKRTKKQYFTPDTDLAIKSSNLSFLKIKFLIIKKEAVIITANIILSVIIFSL